MILLDGVRKRFGRKQVLAGVSLRVPAGSAYALLGRNGSGKSTALKILMGLTPVDEGRATVLGVSPWTADPALFHELGFVSADRPMYGDWKVGRMLDWLSTVYASWDRGLVAGLVEKLRLDPKAKIEKLSRGGQASVSLIAALGAKPKVLILDEPTSGLDAWVRRTFVELIATLVKEQTCTVLIASHDMPEVQHLADQVGMLHDGRLVAQVSRADIAGGLHRLICDPPVTQGNALTEQVVATVQGALIVRGDPEVAARDLEAKGVRVARREPVAFEDAYIDLTDPELVGGSKA
jgi:ABC-2 type transport system ATP-binding protein